MIKRLVWVLVIHNLVFSLLFFNYFAFNYAVLKSIYFPVKFIVKEIGNGD